MHVFWFREFGLKMPIHAPKLFLGGNRGRGGAILTPTNSFLLLGVYTSVSNLVKIDEEMRPWEYPQTDRRTDAKRFYYLSYAICYRYGADNKNRNKYFTGRYNICNFTLTMSSNVATVSVSSGWQWLTASYRMCVTFAKSYPVFVLSLFVRVFFVESSGKMFLDFNKFLLKFCRQNWTYSVSHFIALCMRSRPNSVNRTLQCDAIMTSSIR